MPSAWTNVDANFPTITQDGDIREQILAIYNYMYSLTEELKYTLENLDRANWNDLAIENFSSGFTEQIKTIDGGLVRALSLIEGLSESVQALQQRADEMDGAFKDLTETVASLADRIN